MSSNSIELKDRSGGNGSTSADFTNSDWICGDVECKHVNFGRRTVCQKCQKERSGELSSGPSGVSSAKKKLGTEIGKAAAEKSRGLFSAEDWQCSKCANVNWARRQTCNMCNAPKFCDVEERTGYGGGYNDRGVVEYRERSESDSEYDEFGRLKKRKGNRNHKEKIMEETTKASSYEIAEDDDDDDEEEDGDGDLSKYDLWGDDEVVAAAVKTTVAKPNDKTAPIKRKSRSRSRSRSSSSATSFTSGSSSSTVSTRSSSSTSSSSRGRRTSHSRSSSTSTFDSRCSRSRQPHQQLTTKLRNEEKQKSISKTRSISKTHSHQSYSSHKSTHRNNSKSRSRSTSSARKRKPERTSRIRSRDRSPSGSRKYSCSNTSAKYKRSNRSRSPKAGYRKRSRTRSRSISAGKRRR